ncbi:uncharacterized protein LOC105252054 isoform X2 [Camponotus floridanus]|nr:uncharacterized protein LOC105252054 isoform X2 [Camponotus floridanus]XP_025268735.1 uncharacterized protein LOC105252054 isoform X2 [Camponotus floridanus]
MAQLETLEAKMASIEVSLSTTPRRKKGGSVSGGVTSPAHRNRDHYKELDALRVALRDKENIIQTLKGQLCNTLSNRLALRNGAPPLTEADRKAAEERLQRLRRDADNKRLAIKNLKLALERLDITDNIDVRIQQAELEYRLGREELELLTLHEESRALQTALELAETQEKQKNDTIFSCISGSTQVTIHAIEVSADPKSPRFGAGPRDDAIGLYVDWAVEDSGLCKGDRILEVNGKLVVGAGRSDLARLLAVAPDAAQIVVLRKGESLAALRTLRSDNLRLTHRIGYLEEQVRDLLAPSRTEVPTEEPSPNRQEHVQVFQKGPQVTALVANLPGLNVRSCTELRQSLPTVRSKHNDHSRRSTDSRNQRELDFSSDGVSTGHHKSRNRQKHGLQLARSTASLDCKQSLIQSQMQRRRSPRVESTMEHLHKNRKSISQLQSLEFDSEPTYYRLQDSQSRASENSEVSTAYTSSQETKTRPAPPKKPLRLSLHRAASLQSVESAPPTALQHDMARKPTKRNHRGDPPVEKNISRHLETNGGDTNSHLQESLVNPPQPPPRTPSRAESCQSALRWPSPKPRPHLTSVPMEKWC